MVYFLKQILSHRPNMTHSQRFKSPVELWSSTETGHRELFGFSHTKSGKNWQQKESPLFSPRFISPDCEAGHLRYAAQESAPAHHDAAATPVSWGCKLRASSSSPAGEITHYTVMLQSHGLSYKWRFMWDSLKKVHDEKWKKQRVGNDSLVLLLSKQAGIKERRT